MGRAAVATAAMALAFRFSAPLGSVLARSILAASGKRPAQPHASGASAMSTGEQSIHEVDFCGQVAAAAERLFAELADIYTGRRRDWSMPADDIFIRSLESHLDWPVQLATAYLIDRTDRNKTFDAKVQQWLADQDWIFVRNDADQWRAALNNMAKTLAYVWANRLIFYKALRARFTDLPRLELRRSVKTPDDAAKAFDSYLQKAVERSGDYEPLLFPNAEDWASGIVFEAASALDAWRGLLRGIEAVDFKDVQSDIVGRIFQKLIGPEERHRYGQDFTGDDVVDFRIREDGGCLLDLRCRAD